LSGGQGRRGGRQRHRRRQPDRGGDEALLAIHERVQRPLRRLLRLEELPVQLGRLLLQPLERGQAVLRHPQGVRQRGGAARLVG
jgi:hypothetical protein